MVLDDAGAGEATNEVVSQAAPPSLAGEPLISNHLGDWPPRIAPPSQWLG